MALYTVVDEGYDIQVYRKVTALCNVIAKNNLYFTDIEEDDLENAVPATAKQIAKALRISSIVGLCEEAGSRDWKYRIEKHTTTWD